MLETDKYKFDSDSGVLLIKIPTFESPLITLNLYRKLSERFEVYQLHHDGAESMLQTEDEFVEALHYGEDFVRAIEIDLKKLFD